MSFSSDVLVWSFLLLLRFMSAPPFRALLLFPLLLSAKAALRPDEGEDNDDDDE